MAGSMTLSRAQPSPGDIQRAKLLAMHNQSKRGSRMIEVAEESARPDTNAPVGAKHNTPQQRTMNLSVEVSDPGENEADSDAYKTQGGRSVARRRAARAQIEEMLRGLPLGTVLAVNRVVIKAQAHIRGVISRKQFRHAMKRQSGNASMSAEWNTQGSKRPDQDEIAAFVESTQITQRSCKGHNITVQHGTLSVVAKAGAKKEGTQESSTANDSMPTFASPKVAPYHSPAPTDQEGDEQEMKAQRTTSAGYFQFKTTGIQYGEGSVGRYLSLDLSQSDEHKASTESLENSCIPTAFVHVLVAATALKNMDGLFGKSDPFYTISRVDDPGSLEETTCGGLNPKP